MARKPDPPVRHPLDPDVMTRLGALKQPPPAGPFDPGKAWSATYRIWMCYGRSRWGNVEKGTLTLERRPTEAGQRIAVRQELANAQGKLHRIRATIDCRRDELAMPVSWALASRFEGQHTKGLPRMDAEQRGAIDGGTWTRTLAGRTDTVNVPQPLTADWTLFEALRRMPLNAGAERRFHLLEALGALKADHRLSCRGAFDVTWGRETLRLHRFDHLGRGVYPTEWWLDDAHRLVLVTTGPRTYILDREEVGS